jgi:tripartite-type tricarboxylate transporter receptor subunit TctC
MTLMPTIKSATGRIADRLPKATRSYDLGGLNMRRWLSASVAACLCVLAGKPANAQDYPNRPVRIIVPFAAGGSADLTIRSVSLHLGERLKRPFVIEPKPGAGGQSGIELALSAPNDGYTLISTPSGAVSILPNLRNVQFDPGKDLEPVAQRFQLQLP